MVFGFFKRKKEKIEEPDIMGPAEEDELRRFRERAPEGEAPVSRREMERGGPGRDVPPEEAPSPKYIPPEFRGEEEKAPMPTYEPMVRKKEGEVTSVSVGPEKRVPIPEKHSLLHKDKLEIILSKLDTIDARLRYIEEKLNK